MKLTKTFLKFALLVISLAFILTQDSFAQVTYTSKNTSTANGTVGTVPVTDVSNNGATVDRLAGDQTPVNFPMIGISETVATPILQANGSYNIVYTFLIQNYGAIDLRTINAVNDLSTVFTSPLTYSVTSLTSNLATLTVNTAFNGNSDKNLLVQASSTLAAGASGTLTLTLNVVTNGQYGVFNSTSTTSAVTNNVDAVLVADASTNNASPNHADGTKTPLNFTDPTPVALNASDIQITKTASTLTPNAGDNVTFTVTARNLGPGDAAPVVVNDILNTTGFTLVNTTPSQGNYDSNTGVWSVGTLLVSGQATLTIVATVLPDKPAGVYVNTASSNHPGDPVATNNSATVTLSPQAVADLRIANTDNKTNYVPGTTNTYTVTAVNLGPSNAPGSIIIYTLPTGITGTWTAVYTGGATGNASGTNNINEIVNLPTGSSVIYTIVVPIPSSQTGNFTSTAAVATAAGINDLNQGNNTAVDDDIRLGDADLAITNTDNKGTYTPGTSNTYTIVATNNGVSDVTGATITYPLPSGVTATWTAVYTGGATGNASGTNSINELVNLPVGATVTYTVIAAIPSNKNGGLTTTANIAVPVGVVDPTTTNNSATDIDTQNSIVNLAITNTDGKTIYVPGVANTYSVIVTNIGPSDAIASNVIYNLPAGFTSTWSATFTGGASGTASGANNINEIVNVPVGGTITYTVVMPILSSEISPEITTVAIVAANSSMTDSATGNNTANDTDTRVGGADLSITNTDGQTTYTPGTSNTYTIVATNNGPSDITGARITYQIPLNSVAAWTANYTGGATGTASGNGDINETVNMPAGSTVIYTVTVAIPSTQTGTYTTTATIALPTGAVDPTSSNNIATDSDNQNSEADLAITNTDGKINYVPGTTNTYTVVATNTGPSDAQGSNVSFTLPAGITTAWTATYSGGATGNASGANNVNETVNLPASGTVTYNIVASIPSNQTGTLTSVATVTPPSSVTDLTTTNNTANDVDLRTGDADLSITNTDNKLVYVPGTNSTYIVVATNNGPSDVNATVTFPIPAGLTASWTAVYNGGATGNTNGSGNINESIHIPVGATVTYTIAAVIPSSQTGSVTTTATIAPAVGLQDPIADNNTATDTDLRIGSTDLSITNTDGQVSYTPGVPNTYVIVATNNGPSDATNAVITYPLPSEVTGSWSAIYTGGATGNTSGTNSINETVNLPIGSTITYTVNAVIPPSQIGPLTTTANISVSSGVDPIPDNNTATDTDTQNSAADLGITNTDSKVIYVPGITNTYTIVASNTGPSDALGTTVNYILPPGISGTWTAVYTGGATGNASGTNNINETVNMPSGSTITYTVVVPVPSNQTGTQFTTSATIAAATGITDANTANNSAIDIDTRVGGADLSITNTDGQSTYTPGTFNTYTVVASNNGPSDVVNANISYLSSSGLTGSWTAAFTGGATGNTGGVVAGIGNANELVNMPAGSTITYTIILNIPGNRVGDFTTTASISLPSGSVDPTPNNNTAVDTDTQNSQADLTITNTDGKVSYTPGTNNTYTVVATNTGPSDAPGSTVTYTLPAGITGTWTATYAGGAAGSANGINDISETVNMPAGSSVTYTVIVTVPSGQTGPFITKAMIAVPTGITDPTPTNNTANDIDLRNSDADLSITNTDNQPNYIPGTTNTYTVVASNIGPSDALNSTVTYTLPAGITSTWTATYTGGASGSASGTNNINETVNMPVGSTITYNVIVPIPSSQSGPFVTVAAIATPGLISDPVTANNTATDGDIQNSQADLSISNTDGQGTYIPGTTNTYTVVAANAGPSDAPGSVITYTLPAGVTATWTATFAEGATGNASGIGNINQSVDLPSGGSVSYTITAAIASNVTGPITTTATIAAASGVVDNTVGNNTASDTDTQNSQADLSITNTDGKTTYTPGVTNTYTIAAANAGPSDAPGTTVTYALPAGITGTWTAVYANGASGAASGTNDINEIVNIPSGGTVTYTVVVPIPANQKSPTFVTTANITAAGGITDATTINNTAVDTDTQNSQADLSISNTDGQNTYTPGTTNTYTVVATNNGPSDALGSTLTYPVPAGVTAQWSAVYTGGATGNANGTGNINETVNLPAGSTVTYTVVAAITSNITGPLTTTATITTPAGVIDPTPVNNVAVDIDTQNSQADLSITNTDGKTIYVPGTTNTYTVIATNTGPSDAVGSTVTYTLPSGVTGTWTAVYAGGATGNASGTNNINETVDMPIGSTITYTVVVPVPSSQTGPLFTTTASISPAAGITDATPANNSATDNDVRIGGADLSITNTDGKLTYTPGTINTYTITATNNGPSDATGATVTYPLPTGVTGTWTAAYTGGATGNASGAGNINETVNMPLNSTVTYTLIANVSPAQTGTLTTTATISLPFGSVDPTPANNSASDQDIQNSQADLSISNTDGRATYIPGTTNTYTVVASNNGPSDAPGSAITYTLPVGVSGTWTAVYAGGATGNASGTGNINESVNLPLSGTATYTIVMTVPANQTGPLTTLAGIVPATGITDVNTANNTAGDTDLRNSQADLGITNTDGQTTYTPGIDNTYIVVATNTGPSDAAGTTVTYTLPAGIAGNWTATFTGGATGNASGTNNINETVSMPAGSSITYTVTALIPADQTGSFTTTASIAAGFAVTDATTGNNAAIDVDLRNSQADLSITNTDGKAIYIPGTTNTYTVVATNAGPSDALGTNLTYTLPNGINGTWTAIYTGGATGNASGINNINETVNMPTGSSITFTVVVPVPSAQTGPLFTTTATITPAAIVTDPTPTNNTAVDNDARIGGADLSITNTDGKLTYTPGTSNTYTVVAANNGPSDVTGANITYPLPAGVSGTWTATYIGGATGNASGTGSINELVNMPIGATITYTVIANIPSAQISPLTTTATISLPLGTVDPVPANNTASDTDLRNSIADLSITNTDTKLIYMPGTTNTYTVIVTNNGPSDALGTTVTYAIPAGSGATWTAVYAGGATGNSAGTNNINETVDMPSGSTISYTVMVAVPSSQTGIFTTTANVSPAGNVSDPTLSNNSAADNDARVSGVDLAITNTDSKLTYTPGVTNTYTVVATNNGPSDAIGATVAYTLPTGINSTWTAVYAGGATGSASGSNNINQSVNMPVGSTITYTVVASIPSTQTGTFTTTATIISPTVLADLVPENNTAIDNDEKNSIIDLKIIKTASYSTPSINTQTTFTLAVSNNGPSEATNVTVTDVLPAGFSYVSATPSIGTYNNTTGVWTIGNMDLSTQATMSMVVMVNGAGSYTNIANVSGAETDSNPGNNSSQVTISPNGLPIANNDAASTDPNTVVTINILANDVKAETDLVPSTVTIITPPQHGTVTINTATGVATYTPTANYSGTDSFTYTVKDANGGTSNIATVTIKVNDVPVIGLAKAVAAPDKNTDCTCDVTYTLTVGNYGITTLNNISITDNMAQTFRGQRIIIKSIRSLGKLVVNPTYDGINNIEMLQSGNSLAVGQIEQIQVVVNVLQVTGALSFQNTATASGTSVTGLKATDQSTNGFKPDPNTNGDVSPAIPTPVDLPKLMVRIPAGFSPNNDGTHDNWVIENACSDVVSMEIYNRWGNLVYKDPNYKNDWHGQCNRGIHIGDDLPEGTYYYILLIKGAKYVGYLTLNR
ncbi:T9SS type B sorting domain-containing protein [Mucilaginibacter agri]|uniref:DUF11 domain-containing protein n=1 Tax=Mucilaginibacter agri TaxID=2695265 RepID=A0A965ZLQ4_9SPHI|nr:gliding motility-associated C-terminal domain-containing protein [Mucilaginibacter agri]NCD72372.1 DUF11 domain-containing protein [Mucilaginibacter agri]